jgi:hypothetical protein
MRFTQSLIAIIFSSIAAFGQGTNFTISGQSILFADTAKWGGSSDSTHLLMGRGNAIYRDSSGTWVAITTDSCSKPIRIERNGARAVWKYEIRYDVRTSSGNTDSSQALISLDTRYCKDVYKVSTCEDWVSALANASYADVAIKDTVITQAHTLGTTWKRKSHLGFVPGGSHLRLCVDSNRLGGATNDSTFFRGLVLRGQ